MDQEHHSIDSLFNDRRKVADPDRSAQEFAQDNEQVCVTSDEPRMSEAELLDSIRIPSAYPGPGSMILPRQRDCDLCEICYKPVLGHQNDGHEWHVPSRLDRAVPGTHPGADRLADQQAAEVQARQLPRGAATR